MAERMNEDVIRRSTSQPFDVLKADVDHETLVAGEATLEIPMSRFTVDIRGFDVEANRGVYETLSVRADLPHNEQKRRRETLEEDLSLQLGKSKSALRRRQKENYALRALGAHLRLEQAESEMNHVSVETDTALESVEV